MTQTATSRNAPSTSTTTGEIPFDRIDYEAFARDVLALREELEAGLGPDDLAHLRKIERWGRICSAVGYATAWPFPNPIAALLISQGQVVRWTMMMHHVGHKGYDRIPGVPPRYTSARFARGWRRPVDFLDWLHPDAWSHEHNTLHHYHTGEIEDPDLVELNLDWLRRAPIPRLLKYPLILLGASTWKWHYYMPRTLRALHYARRRRAGQTETDPARMHPAELRGLDPRNPWNPLNAVGRDLWLRCLLPFVLIRFVLIPLLFLPLGNWAAFSVLMTNLMAELFTNLYTFVIIVPNHAGDDLYRFNTTISDRAEFYVRSVIGSVNYRTGGDLNDFLHGWLNYQIEHHVWPDLPLLKYQQAQPRLKAICDRHGVPYVQQGVFQRLGQLIRIMTGATSMPWAATVPRSERPGRPETPTARPAFEAG
ncbi:MAG: fatty acid desaturase [Isosphaeraceae bacterium]